MPLLHRKRTLQLTTQELLRVTAAVERCIKSHTPSTFEKTDRVENGRVEASKIAFAAAFFRRGAGRWNVLSGVSRGEIDIEATCEGVRITTTHYVGNSVTMAILHVGFFVAALLMSGNTFWALLIALFALPIWVLFLTEAYVGSLQESLRKSIEQAFTDNPQRGLSVGHPVDSSP